MIVSSVVDPCGRSKSLMTAEVILQRCFMEYFLSKHECFTCFLFERYKYNTPFLFNSELNAIIRTIVCFANTRKYLLYSLNSHVFSKVRETELVTLVIDIYLRSEQFKFFPLLSLH